MLAGVAILILVAWRPGVLSGLFDRPRTENTARRAGLITDDLSRSLASAGGAPRISGGGFGAVARGGVPDNGFTSTTGELAALTAAMPRSTLLPNAAELIPSTRPREVRENSRKLNAAELSPFRPGGGGVDLLAP